MSTPYWQEFNRLHESNFVLWHDISDSSWLRERGRTRILVIDDLFCNANKLFEGRPELQMEYRKWLNVEVDFFRMPSEFDADNPQSALFTEDWFADELEAKLNSSLPPIAAIFLDLNFGLTSVDAKRAQGLRFLRILKENKELKEIPVIIMTTVDYEEKVRRMLKEYGPYVAYIKKSYSRSLTDDMIKATLEHGLIAEPAISAYSLVARKVAKQIRRFAITQEKSSYENSDGVYPMPVLFLGDIGSGKSFLAKHLIDLSPRRGKLDVYTFTGGSSAGDLFGVGPFTDGAVTAFVDRETGALLSPRLASDPRAVRLSTIGAILKADVSSRAVDKLPTPSEFESRKGALFLDELSSATPEYQQLLLDVLNHGSLTPSHVGGQRIPTKRSLDVWFLFACPSAAYPSVREDLRNRLLRAGEIKVPPLKDRRQDILPLFLYFAEGSHFADPATVLLPEAQTLVQEMGMSLSVREIRAAIEDLKRHCTLPYSSDEVRLALSKTKTHWDIQKQNLFIPPTTTTAAKFNVDSVVEWLAEQPMVRFEHIPSCRNPAAKIRRAASALRLGLLHKVLEIVLGAHFKDGDVVPVREVVQRFSGNNHKETNSYWDELAQELTCDAEATIALARQSSLFLSFVRSPKFLERKGRQIGALLAVIEAEKPYCGDMDT